MGNIFRKVDICGLTAEGKRLGRVKGVDALVDTGATKTVISSALARKLGGRSLNIQTTIEGRRVGLKLAGVTLRAPGCDIDALVVAVDDTLVRRAGVGSTGEAIEVILGHDYLQNKRAALRYVGPRDEVVCGAGPLTVGRRVRAARLVRRPLAR